MLSEHVIIAMLGDENKPAKDVAVNKITSLRETLTAGHTDTFEESCCEEAFAVRKFKVPFINEKATSYHQLVGPCLDVKPPLLHHVTNNELISVRQKLMFFKQPCHNQVVERHVKLVTQASATVAGFEKRGGLISRMMNLRSPIKTFNSTKQYV